MELSKKGWAVTEPVFSPNGKWLAVGTQAGELHKQHLHPDAAGVEQPQIHLIETATGTVRETLSAPLAYLKSLCFSPDGKTLASGGPGRVLLWDIADLAAGAK